MENVISDWKLLKTEVEFEIIKKYSNFGRIYAMFFAREKQFFIIFSISNFLNKLIFLKRSLKLA